jgi:hypothetical protein
MKTPVRLLAALAFLAPVLAGEVIEAFGLRWDVPTASDWKVVQNESTPVFEQLEPRPTTHPRRPSQFALAQTPPYRKLELELEVKKEPLAARNRRTSLILVYAWRGPDHFNYAHLSVDTGKQQPVHNGIFHVYGGDRVRISSEEGPATLQSEEWHKVRLVYDGVTGRVDVFVNGHTSPAMRGVDLSLGAGRFGIGSFFDLGSFRNVRYRGEPVP